jgi:hypothetical protein
VSGAVVNETVIFANQDFATAVGSLVQMGRIGLQEEMEVREQSTPN